MDNHYLFAKAKVTEAFQLNGVSGATNFIATIQANDRKNLLLNDLAHSLINKGNFSEAEYIVQSMEASYEKAEAARATAKRMLAEGLVSRAVALIEIAQSISEDLDVLPDKAEDTYQLSLLLASLKVEESSQVLLREAIEIARRGEDTSNFQYSLDSSRVLAHIARDLSSSAHWTMATEVASKIKHDVIRERTIRQLSEK